MYPDSIYCLVVLIVDMHHIAQSSRERMNDSIRDSDTISLDHYM